MLARPQATARCSSVIGIVMLHATAVRLRGATLVFLAFVASAPSGALSAQSSRRVDAARLIADVETLSSPAMQGRRTGTDGNRRARTFIASRFRQLGLTPLAATYEQRF